MIIVWNRDVQYGGTCDITAFFDTANRTVLLLLFLLDETVDNDSCSNDGCYRWYNKCRKQQGPVTSTTSCEPTGCTTSRAGVDRGPFSSSSSSVPFTAFILSILSNATQEIPSSSFSFYWLVIV
jgi:hypothetical protein